MHVFLYVYSYIIYLVVSTSSYTMYELKILSHQTKKSNLLFSQLLIILSIHLLLLQLAQQSLTLLLLNRVPIVHVLIDLLGLHARQTLVLHIVHAKHLTVGQRLRQRRRSVLDLCVKSRLQVMLLLVLGLEVRFSLSCQVFDQSQLFHLFQMSHLGLGELGLLLVVLDLFG